MRAPRVKRTAAARNEARWAWAFILPTMLGLIILNFYPAIDTVIQSFHKTGDFGMGNKWVGLENYKNVLGSGETWQSLLNTVKYAIIEVPFGAAIALGQFSDVMALRTSVEGFDYAHYPVYWNVRVAEG